MALKSYLEKRNFQKTSEPKGKKKITGKFRFVVQKHQAQQLHYDFRIEHEGSSHFQQRKASCHACRRPPFGLYEF